MQNRVVEQADIDLRNLTYHRFVELGRAPTVGEMARTTALSVDEVRSSLRRLHEVHALVLNPATVELRMVNPFSAVPTAYRVHTASRWWYANCAWDAFGICAALHADGRIEASCPDCGAQIAVAVANQRPDDRNLFFHCLVPAVRWWDDIVFT